MVQPHNKPGFEKTLRAVTISLLSNPIPDAWRGRNSPSDGSVDEYWEMARNAMGQTQTIAYKMDLARMKPDGLLSSTNYGLAGPGSEYLVYKPASKVSFV